MDHMESRTSPRHSTSHPQNEITILNSTNLISALEASQMAGVTRRTIYSWIENKQITAYRVGGGEWRIEAETVLAMFTRNR
ncbi:helix-turn-helix domain-containing protein [Rhodococcus sp. MS16]|nr:helix-turn-helix domain-containing protein [Rhodococcus sp. MS16]